jgi:homoserine kinase
MRFVTDETDAVAVYISGAGPTIVAVVIDDDDAFLKQINRFTSDLTLKWTTRKMHLQRQGAHVRLL